MTRLLLVNFLLIVILLSLTTASRTFHVVNVSATAASPALPGVQTVPLYRLFSHETGIHFYTIDVNRKLSAMSAGWTVEGVATNVLDQQAPDTVPLYVLTNKLIFYGLYGDVFTYTTTTEERDKLLAAPKFGNGISGGTWSLDSSGIACYIAAHKLSGTIPLYRLIHPPKNPDILKFTDFDSLYTTSESEMTDAITNHGYKFVRIEGYVWPQPTTVSMQPPAATQPGPKILAGGKPGASPDTVLLNRGCTRPAMGSYKCPTIAGYEVCESYRKNGKVTACTTSANEKVQAAMEKLLFSVGCGRFLGRPDEFLCKTQKGLDLCETYRQKGTTKKCVMPKIK
ncbi:MAG TPA: hypothetical protein VHR36_17285 [Pyrinomonadaceae bacterium]|nr:hypothetical protein [Pyrinomonadaceae bacterium]